jgi:hypothetical protein
LFVFLKLNLSLSRYEFFSISTLALSSFSSLILDVRSNV